MTRRDINWVLIMKTVWLTGGLTVWQIGLGSCMVAPDCWLPETKFISVLGLLSFPSGPLLLFLNGILANSVLATDMLPALKYTFECLGLTVVGYVQWCHVVPSLFAKPEFRKLSLHLIPATNTCKLETLPMPISKPRVRVRQVKAFKAFDEAGRTPLERVIQS